MRLICALVYAGRAAREQQISEKQRRIRARLEAAEERIDKRNELKALLGEVCQPRVSYCSACACACVCTCCLCVYICVFMCVCVGALAKLI